MRRTRGCEAVVGCLLLVALDAAAAPERTLTAPSETVRAAAATDLRSAPSEDSRVMARINQRSAVEVIGRRGRWVEVRFHGRHGWVLRAALDGEVPTAATAAAEPTAPRKRGRRGRRRDAADERAAGDASRMAAVAERARDVAAGLVGMTAPAREPAPRSSFSRARRARNGAPVRSVIGAAKAELLSEPDGGGRVIASLIAGDEVRVLARGKRRWMLVSGPDGESGWLPAVALENGDHLVRARLADDVGPAELGDAETGDAEATPTSGDEARPEDDDVMVAVSAVPVARARTQIAAHVAAGYTSGGMQHDNRGERDGLTRFAGPSVELGGAVSRRLIGRLWVGARADGFLVEAGKLRYRGAERDVSDTTARAVALAAKAVVGLGDDARGSWIGLQAGYRYERFDVAEPANMAGLPSEIARGPVVGALGALALAADLQVSGGLEAMVAGRRDQTPGLEDGARGKALAGLARAELDWSVARNVALSLAVRVGLARTTFRGESAREAGVVDARRVDQSYTGLAGVSLGF